MVDEVWLARRAAIVAEGNELLEKAEEWEVTGDRDPYVVTERVMPDRASERRLHQLQKRYRKLLPKVVVARCPHTGVVVGWSIDVGDLDGWFWDTDHQITREPQLPPTWLAMTGAVRLRGPVASAPFMCQPGPAVPYVVPRVLDAEGVRAVIAQVPIGRHLGWAVSYFGPRLRRVEGIGRWGGNWAPRLSGNGVEHGWFSVTDNDYELAPYLVSGKLLWIAPDDGTATLREGADGCPYLGLDGPRECAYIKRGNARYFRPGEADEFTEIPCLRVEFDGTGMPRSQLDRLRALLALEPINCLPRGKEALAGYCAAAEYLPPGTRLHLHQASPWRLTVVHRGEQPTGAALDRVRFRLLDTLAQLSLTPGEICQLSASGDDWDRYGAER